MHLLITGGAGYIGSHIINYLFELGEKIVILDNLSTGIYSKIAGKGDFIQGDICDENLVDNIFKHYEIEGIINLAALKSVEESEIYPDKYLEVNVKGTDNLLKNAIKHKVRFFIQSSSAAVYGINETGIVSENSQLSPISNYGKTKLASEKLLDEAINNRKIKGVSLRYFNVVGALNFELRDLSKNNLFPILKKCIDENRPPLIFGDDYDTPDGTCIRDYVHVVDIAKAHIAALNAIRKGTLPAHLNLGTGVGYSVRQIIEAMLQYRKANLIPIVNPRRPGDPAKLIADITAMRKYLKFESKYVLKDMIESTY